jgi:hypothetical protein
MGGGMRGAVNVYLVNQSLAAEWLGREVVSQGIQEAKEWRVAP